MNEVPRPPAGYRWTDEDCALRVQRAAEIQSQAGMLPDRNTVLSDAVRQHHAAASSRLIQADGFASEVFDVTIRRIQAGRL